MLKLTGSEDFYPTPENLLEQITLGLDWDKVFYVLEPSAGKGNICDYIKKRCRNRNLEIDCIEIEPELRAILKSKQYRVIHDDFLRFHTYKHYDLIIMNPPFSQCARHLLKAMEVQQVSGGGIICILNAETIRNTYTNERKELAQKLKEYNAEIKFYENAFISAENPTDVEIAVLKFIVPAPKRKTTIFETLREKEYQEFESKREFRDITEADFVRSFVALYNMELEYGLRLYDEFLEFQNRVMDSESEIEFKVKDEYEFSVNTYVRKVRRKYWDKLFKHPKFCARLTSNLANQYLSQVNEFANYDFSYYNIKTVQIEVAKTLIKGVEDCILDLFDELSCRHSWHSEFTQGNIHYYNGWRSNECWKINKRVVLMLKAYDSYRFEGKERLYLSLHGASVKLSDIEKVLNYLDNGETGEVDLDLQLERVKESGQTKDIHLKYFDVTFYKKGTCHLTFTNERLLKKLNIFGSQKKGWLPHGYGNRKYSEMNSEEQCVIDSFEGKESYNETLADTQYYLCDLSSLVPALGM